MEDLMLLIYSSEIKQANISKIDKLFSIFLIMNVKKFHFPYISSLPYKMVEVLTQ